MIKISVGLPTVITMGRGRTLRLNVLVLFCDNESVAVIEYVAVEDNTAGVPLIAAVFTSNNNPVGSTGPIANVT